MEIHHRKKDEEECGRKQHGDERREQKQQAGAEFHTKQATSDSLKVKANKRRYQDLVLLDEGDIACEDA